MSPDDGMRRSSTISTPTSHPSSDGSTRVTASASLPLSSVITRSPTSAAPAAVRSSERSGSLLVSCLAGTTSTPVSPGAAPARASPADHPLQDLVHRPGLLFLGDPAGGPGLLHLLEAAPDHGGIVQLPLDLVSQQLTELDDRVERQERPAKEQRPQSQRRSLLSVSSCVRSRTAPSAPAGAPRRGPTSGKPARPRPARTRPACPGAPARPRARRRARAPGPARPAPRRGPSGPPPPPRCPPRAWPRPRVR